jgi:hypothetical protein
MKPLFKLALVLTCLSLSTYAQKSVIPGYVVQLNGDTTKGYIDYKNWNKNPTSIVFFKEIGAQKQTLGLSNIQAFGVKSEKFVDDYIAKTVKIDYADQSLERMTTDPNPEYVEKMVFLQKLLTGPVSIFKYTDTTDRKHYFAIQNNVYEELINKKYKLKTSQVGTNTMYKTQLTKLLSDCSAITASQIEQTPYTEKAITELVVKYINCKSPSTTIKLKNTEKITAKFGIFAGAAYASLKFSYVNNGFNSSTGATGGISMLLTMPRTREKIGIYAELQFRNFNFKKEEVNGYIIQRHEFQGNYIRLNTFFRYTFVQSKIKPLINIGFSNGFAMGEIDKSTLTNTFGSTETTRKSELFGIRKHEEAIVLGLGASIKNIGFELRAENSNGFIQTKDVKASVNTAYLLVHYQF